MLAELKDSLIECCRDPIADIAVTSRCGDDILPIGSRVKVGMDVKLCYESVGIQSRPLARRI